MTQMTPENGASQPDERDAEIKALKEQLNRSRAESFETNMLLAASQKRAVDLSLEFAKLQVKHDGEVARSKAFLDMLNDGRDRHLELEQRLQGQSVTIEALETDLREAYEVIDAVPPATRQRAIDRAAERRAASSSEE